MTDMRVLFFGADVLGSVYAARQQEAGAHVTVLAHGQRLADDAAKETPPLRELHHSALRPAAAA